MSHGGWTLVMRAMLVAFLIVVGATFRALVGPGKQRGLIMVAGTLGGVSFGVLTAYLMSHWTRTDASVLCACVGMSLGWGVAWVFARQIPREAL
jgi:hypothetical protein